MNRIAHHEISIAGLGRTARRMRFVWCLAAAIALVLAAVAAPRASAATQPAQVAWSGSVSPALAPGSAFGTYNFTITHGGPATFPTGPQQGHCLERNVLAQSGAAVLRTGADVTAVLPQDIVARIHWLLLSSRRALTGPSAGTEAAAHQSAIWQLTDGGSNTIVPGAGNDAARARATALVAASIAGAASIGRVVAIAPQGVAPVGGGTQSVLVTGAPFTQADLSITSANGTFAGGVKAASVDLGAEGQAVVSVTAGAGAVAIAGTARGSEMVVADFTGSQDFGYVAVTDTPLAAQLSFPAAPQPVQPTQPTQPGVTGPTPESGGAVDRPASGTRLTITKTGARTVTAGSGLTYRIRVCTAGKATARDVVVRYRIPRGLALAKRVPGASVSDGVVTITISTLRAGDCRSYVISLQVFTSTVGQRCGAATAVATNAGQVRSAQCCVVVQRRPARIVPAVTG